MKKTVKYFCFGLVLSLLLFSCSKTIEGDLVITNVNIIDVESGDVTIGMDVIIIGDSISEILEHQVRNYDAPEIIDGTDKYLIPGLWDMHGHWIESYEYFFPMLLANGVVGIRDMWGNLPALAAVKKMVNSDSIAGPDVITAGFMVDGKEPYWPAASVSAATPEEGREIVRRQKADGVDFIKVYSRLERDVYFAIADECRKQNIPMAGHIPAKIALEEAINSDHQSIEHFYQIKGFLHPQYENYMKMLQGKENSLSLSDKAKKYIEEFGVEVFDTFELDSLDTSRVPKLVALLANSNSWVSPTLATTKGYFRVYDSNFNPETLNRYMPDYAIENYYIQDTLRTKLDSARFEWSLKDYKTTIELIKPMIDGGVKFLAGTDYVVRFCYPGFSLHDELQTYVEEAGMTPLQALQTATINPAIFLKMEGKMGSVTVSKRASLLLLHSNPLEDIKNTQDIKGLILRGKYYPEEVLTEGLNNLVVKNAKPLIREKLDTIIKQDGVDVAIQKYYELKQAEPDTYNFHERQLVSLGHKLLERGKTEAAIKIFKLNTKEYPTLSHGFAGLGDAYLAAGEKEKARKAWKKCNELGGYSTHTQLEKLEAPE